MTRPRHYPRTRTPNWFGRYVFYSAAVRARLEGEIAIEEPDGGVTWRAR